MTTGSELRVALGNFLRRRIFEDSGRYVNPKRAVGPEVRKVCRTIKA